jgi:hypothetical protein
VVWLAPRALKEIVRPRRLPGVVVRPLNFTVRPQSTMSQYLKSIWVRVGLVLLVVGATPLLFIITAAALGLWPDPNPNPVGPGILFGLTFWPAIICIVVGVIRARGRRAA